MRYLSFVDKALCELDTAIRTLFVPKNRSSLRLTPGNTLSESVISRQEQKHVAGLMRVNHAGEVCAQALYQGQSLTAKLPNVRAQMTQAAYEEVEHLAWCEQRLRELNSQPSILNPLWYMSSLLLGMIAGLAGDKWSLGFVAETERQVTAHLDKHIQNLPKDDEKTRAILQQMKEDEAHHAEMAHAAGAAQLPLPIKKLMQTISKLMTTTSYRI